MAIDLQDCLDRIEGSIAGIPDEIGTSYVNEAGERLVSLRAWRWLEGARAELSTVTGQDWVALPSDFSDALSAPIAASDAMGDFALIDQDQFERIRRAGVAYTWRTVGTVIEVEGDSGLERRIEIYPVPTETTTGRWTMRYRAGWKVVTADDSVLRLAKFCEPLFWSMLESVVHGREERDEGSVEARLDGIRQTDAYRGAVSRDARSQPRRGPLAHGLIGKHRRRLMGPCADAYINGPVEFDA